MMKSKRGANGYEYYELVPEPIRNVDDSMHTLANQNILITGGTGSIGSRLVTRLLPQMISGKIVVLSRDEAKQYSIKKELAQYSDHLEFIIGDVRDFNTVANALKGVNVVFHCAALKHVNSCEYYPYETISTNCYGAINIINAIHQHQLPVNTVIGLSTDKAVEPASVMGLCKALQEHILVNANLLVKTCLFASVRFGNVLATRGSVIPMFIEQVKQGKPITLTNSEMTRFFMTIDDAIETMLTCYEQALRGEVWVKACDAFRLIDVVNVIADNRVPVEIIGDRPGEKLHESLITKEEVFRSTLWGQYMVISSSFPELTIDRQTRKSLDCIEKPYLSQDHLLSAEEIKKMLVKEKLICE